MLKLLVVEDHALVREGLVRLLAQVEDGCQVSEAADFETALTVLDGGGIRSGAARSGLAGY